MLRSSQTRPGRSRHRRRTRHGGRTLARRVVVDLHPCPDRPAGRQEWCDRIISSAVDQVCPCPGSRFWHCCAAAFRHPACRSAVAPATNLSRQAPGLPDGVPTAPMTRIYYSVTATPAVWLLLHTDLATVRRMLHKHSDTDSLAVLVWFSVLSVPNQPVSQWRLPALATSDPNAARVARDHATVP